MTDILDRYLIQLNDCLASSSANRGNEAADICSDLSLFCIDNITETEIGNVYILYIVDVVAPLNNKLFL